MSSAEFTCLELEHRQDVTVITLNRPERLNALSYELLTELRAAVGTVGADASVRALVLTGAGRAFSSGADLKAGTSEADFVLRTYYNPLVVELLDLDKPVIAAVNGPAVGAGASLTFACDFRIAAESAKFQLAFAKVGFVPDSGSTWLLPRIIGAGRATEMAMLGRRVTADEALQWGLVTQVVADTDILASALGLAAELALMPRTAWMTRTLLREGGSTGLTDHLETEAVMQRKAQTSPEHLEARQAFIEKRSPRFSAT